MYSYGPPHMANQKQDDQLEHTYSSYVMIWDVTLKTCQRRWTIGRRGERGSGISVLAALDDDDDDDTFCAKIFGGWRVKIVKRTHNKQTNKQTNKQIIIIIGGWHHQTSANKRHDPKRITQENEKTTQDETLQQKPHQRNKYLGCAPSQIFVTLSQVDQRET